MSQSKTSYGVNTPKDSARTRREQPDNQSEESGDQPVEPACRTREVGRGIDRREWRETTYDGRTRAFFEPCSWCFPDGPPDDDIEIVVKSCRKPTSYHRPRSDESACQAHSADSPETDTETHIPEDAIESLAELQEGQRVIWKNRERPLRVTETTSKSNGTITLHGPSGGEYHVEERSERPQPYYLPKTGYLSEIVRVRVETRAERA